MIINYLTGTSINKIETREHPSSTLCRAMGVLISDTSKRELSEYLALPINFGITGGSLIKQDDQLVPSIAMPNAFAYNLSTQFVIDGWNAGVYPVTLILRETVSGDYITAIARISLGKVYFELSKNISSVYETVSSIYLGEAVDLQNANTKLKIKLGIGRLGERFHSWIELYNYNDSSYLYYWAITGDVNASSIEMNRFEMYCSSSAVNSTITDINYAPITSIMSNRNASHFIDISDYYIFNFDVRNKEYIAILDDKKTKYINGTISSKILLHDSQYQNINEEVEISFYRFDSVRHPLPEIAIYNNNKSFVEYTDVDKDLYKINYNTDSYSSVIFAEGKDGERNQYIVNRTIEATKSGVVSKSNTKMISEAPEFIINEGDTYQNDWMYATPLNYSTINGNDNLVYADGKILKTIYIPSQSILILYYIKVGANSPDRNALMCDAYQYTSNGTIQQVYTNSLVTNEAGNTISESTSKLDNYMSFKMVHVHDKRSFIGTKTNVYTDYLICFWTEIYNIHSGIIHYAISFDNGMSWIDELSGLSMFYNVDVSNIMEVEQANKLFDFDVDYNNGRFVFAIDIGVETIDSSRLKDETWRSTRKYAITFNIDEYLFHDITPSIRVLHSNRSNNVVHVKPEIDFFGFDYSNPNYERPKIWADKARGTFWYVINNSVSERSYIYTSIDGSSWGAVFCPNGNSNYTSSYNPNNNYGFINSASGSVVDSTYSSRVKSASVVLDDNGFLHVAVERIDKIIIMFKLSPKYLSLKSGLKSGGLTTNYLSNNETDIVVDSGGTNNVIYYDNDNRLSGDARVGMYYTAQTYEQNDSMGGIEFQVISAYNKGTDVPGTYPEAGFGNPHLSLSRDNIVLSYMQLDDACLTTNYARKNHGWLALGYKPAIYGSRMSYMYGAPGTLLYRYAYGSGVYSQWTPTVTGGSDITTNDVYNVTIFDMSGASTLLDKGYITFTGSGIPNILGNRYATIHNSLNQFGKKIKIDYILFDDGDLESRASIRARIAISSSKFIDVTVSFSTEFIYIDDNTSGRSSSMAIVDTQTTVRSLEIGLERVLNTGNGVKNCLCTVYSNDNIYNNYGLVSNDNSDNFSLEIDIDTGDIPTTIDIGFPHGTYELPTGTLELHVKNIEIGNESIASRSTNKVGKPIASYNSKIFFCGSNDYMSLLSGQQSSNGDEISLLPTSMYLGENAITPSLRDGVRYYNSMTGDIQFGISGLNNNNYSNAINAQAVPDVIVLDNINIKEFSLTVKYSGGEPDYFIGNYTTLKNIIRLADSISSFAMTMIGNRTFPNIITSAFMLPHKGDDIEIGDYVVGYDGSNYYGRVVDVMTVEYNNIESTQIVLDSLGFGNLSGCNHVAIYGQRIFIDLDKELFKKEFSHIQVSVSYMLNQLTEITNEKASYSIPTVFNNQGNQIALDSIPDVLLDNYWHIGTIDITNKIEVSDYLISDVHTLTVPNYSKTTGAGKNYIKHTNKLKRSRSLIYRTPAIDMHKIFYMKSAMSKNPYVWILNKFNKFDLSLNVIKNDVVITSSDGVNENNERGRDVEITLEESNNE